MSSSESDSTLQSPELRKHILRSALKTAQSLSENVNKNTIINLECILDKTDIIANECDRSDIVDNQEEVVLDAHVISLSSQIMRRCTLNVTKEINNYVPQEFAENIKKFLIRQSNTHVEEPNWSLLENFVTKCFYTMPHFKSLQGCMDPVPVKEKMKRKAKREAQMPTKRPKKLTVADKAEESVEDSVEKIKRLINSYYESNEEPLHFFKLVIHPTNFGRTVENLLHTAFLVRDSILRLVKDNKGALIVQVVPRKEIHAAKKSGKRHGIQNVFSINADEWRILTKVYCIKKPMIDFSK